ncbi:polygalacturonase inhibitor-like [Oryza brachyantha]|uniref:Leucine-rich repeat-containing N-terminal plant-type domain-containing protein n=1 Tax=Oryza brachyantha TaxID=4533 RepID=J3LQ55_ORYBR|nr:polygalacturonase inhibitor-like [Oryza brachyantha]
MAMELSSRMFHHTVGVLLAILVVATAATSKTDGLCDKSDKAALLAIKSALGNPPALSVWNSSTPCCSWDGVSCNATTARVTDLTIFALNISAPVPAAIANLTKLQTLNLAYNQLYGPIPSFLGPRALPDLTFLRLDGNRLTGTIPPTATVFNLLLTGPLPATFGSAVFGDVDIANNQLTGDASMLFGAKKTLNALRLSRNRFTFDLGRVELPEQLDILVIDHNMVYGSIPAAAAAPGRKWLAFDVSYNQLCGPIPQGRYTHRFGAKHFAGNKCLCDRPLPPCS